MKYEALGYKHQSYNSPTGGVFTLHAGFTCAWSCTGNGDVYDSDTVTICIKGLTGQDAGRYEIPQVFVQKPTPAVTVTPSMFGIVRNKTGYER